MDLDPAVTAAAAAAAKSTATAVGSSAGKRAVEMATEKPRRRKARRERAEIRAEGEAQNAINLLVDVKEMLQSWPATDPLPTVFLGRHDCRFTRLLDELDRRLALVPDPELRRRFHDLHFFLGYGALWDGEIGKDIFLLGLAVCDHGVAVLTAYLRGDDLPEESLIVKIFVKRASPVFDQTAESIRAIATVRLAAQGIVVPQAQPHRGLRAQALRIFDR